MDTLNSPNKTPEEIARDLFKAYIEENPAPDIEIEVDWSAGRFSEAFDYALRGKMESIIMDCIYADFDGIEETDEWLSEVYEYVEKALTQALSADINDEIELQEAVESAMDSLRSSVDDFDIEYHSCHPVIPKSQPINLLMKFYRGEEENTGGLAHLLRIIGLHHSFVMDKDLKICSHFRDYLFKEARPEDFLPCQNLLSNMGILSDDESLLSIDLGVALPMTYGDLLEIDQKVANGEMFDLSIKNPVILSYQEDVDGFINSSKLISIHEESEKPKPVTITIPHDAFYSGLSVKFEESGNDYTNQCRGSVVNVNPHREQEINPQELMHARNQMIAIQCVLTGRHESLENTLGKRISTGYLFNEMLLGESYGAWNAMHYAATLDYNNGRNEMMRHLRDIKVDANLRHNKSLHGPTDLLLQFDGFEDEIDSEGKINPGDELLQLALDISDHQVESDAFQSNLSEDAQQRFIALKIINKNMCEKEKPKQNFRRL